MKMIRTGILCVLAHAVLLAQTPPARPEFEVASIKPSASGPAVGGGQQVHVGVQIDGAQVHCSYLSLKDYIRIAYQVKDFQITGPDWMASERFDIHAKLPAGGRDQLRPMLQNLLEDRFQIKMHRASKEFPVYAIVVAKNVLGAGVRYAHVPHMWSDQYDLKIQVSGRYEAPTHVRRGDSARNKFMLLHLDGDRVVGATGINEARDMKYAQRLIEARTAVTPAQLADPGFNLKKASGG